MKIFTYGVMQADIDVIKCHYGDAEYIDKTECYQDVLALCADTVVINVDNAEPNIVSIIKDYENETKDVDDTKYYYISQLLLDEWRNKYILKEGK